MQTEQEVKQRRPFHEMVVDAINSTMSGEQLITLKILIQETSIPKNHDQIMAAWERACRTLDRVSYIDRVKTSLLEQKQEAEKKEEEKKVKEQATAATS